MTNAYKIAVLPGDGIGPDVCAEATKVLQIIAKLFGHQFQLENGLCGGAAYDKHQSHLPSETIDLIERSDAVLFGSVGGPPNEQEHPKVRSSFPSKSIGNKVLICAVERCREKLLIGPKEKVQSGCEYSAW